jgi:hypothetical protein
MDMVSHETVRMQLALVLSAQMAQVRQIREVVAVDCEARITVVAALDNVQRDPGQDEARVPGHGIENELALRSLTPRLH